MTQEQSPLDDSRHLVGDSREAPLEAEFADERTAPPRGIDLTVGDEVLVAGLADEKVADEKAAQGQQDGPPRGGRRRLKLPLALLAFTVISTFWVGAAQWNPVGVLMRSGGIDLTPVRRTLISHWDEGLIYAACVLAILLTHEMGHFLATLWYRVPASLPFCIPFPISPIGTLGAVIAMDGRRADRKQMFDIGLAGPLAGLAVAVPIMWIGIGQLDLRDPPPAAFSLESPLGVQMALDRMQPPGYKPGNGMIPNTCLNPFFMAGWVGLLITGLNMMPVSQLDGGHVTYALLGKLAHWLARLFMVAAIAYSVYAGIHIWALMIGLVLLLGTDHPPTRDDRAPLGWFRIALGIASLAIPILCFSPKALMP
jgi:hypothetical protein